MAWLLKPRSFVALRLALLALVASAQRTAAQDATVTITGSIVDSLTGDPLARVEVYVTDGTLDQTSVNGQFTLTGVPRNSPFLLVRRIGYKKRAIPLHLPQGRASRIELGSLWISPLYYALDTLRVETDMVRLNPKLSEFYRRRHSGMGQYLTAAEIWKRNAITTSDLFRSILGIQVRCDRGPCQPVTLRGSSRPCPMRILVDGVPTDIEVDMLPPQWIAGIEVYKSVAWTPLELGRSGCGVVVIWTGGER